MAVSWRYVLKEERVNIYINKQAIKTLSSQDSLIKKWIIAVIFRQLRIKRYNNLKHISRFFILSKGPSLGSLIIVSTYTSTDHSYIN